MFSLIKTFGKVFHFAFFFILLLAVCYAQPRGQRVPKQIRTGVCSAPEGALGFTPQGEILARPCGDGRMWVGDGTSVLSFLPRKTWLEVGSDAFLSPPDNYYPFVVTARWDQTNRSGKVFSGVTSRLNVQGSGTNNLYIGLFTRVDNNTDSGGNNSMYGISTTVEVERQVKDGIGGSFAAFIGSGSAGTQTERIIGVQGFAGLAHNGGYTQLGVAGDFSVASSTGGTAQVPNAYILRGTTDIKPFHNITNLYGLALRDWVFRTPNPAIVTNSYGIYADASIDQGVNSRYFIYSLSTSPSFFSGRLDFARNSGTPPTGDSTINQPSVIFNIPAGQASVTITNSLVTANSAVMCTLQQLDATAIIKAVVPASGSFTVHLSATATADVRTACIVFNS